MHDFFPLCSSFYKIVILCLTLRISCVLLWFIQISVRTWRSLEMKRPTTMLLSYKLVETLSNLNSNSRIDEASCRVQRVLVIHVDYIICSFLLHTYRSFMRIAYYYIYVICTAWRACTCIARNATQCLYCSLCGRNPAVLCLQRVNYFLSKYSGDL